MAKLYNVPGTGEPSDLSFDDIHYELTNDDWESQAARKQDRSWNLVREAASRVSRAVRRNKK